MAALIKVNGQIPFEVILPEGVCRSHRLLYLRRIPRSTSARRCRYSSEGAAGLLVTELMNACGISRRAVAIVGRLKHRGVEAGCPPLVSRASRPCLFASISGSSSHAISTTAGYRLLGISMIPARWRAHDAPRLSDRLRARRCAVQALLPCGVRVHLGPIIPPSIVMIVMGYVTETKPRVVLSDPSFRPLGYVTVTSITALFIGGIALFIGGILPGVLMAAALVATSYRQARLYETAAPEEGTDRGSLGGILSGVFTATEAAGVAVAYSLIVGFGFYRELHLADLRPLLVNAALRSCVVMFVATSAFLFAWIVAVGRVPEQVGGQIQALAGSQLSFLIACNVILIVVGMFMESISAIIVIMPILFPLALQLGIDPVHFGVLASVNFCIGIDPVHFGVLASVNFCIGMVTPPYGATLFVACTIAGTSISDVAIWTLRPVLAMVAVLAVITLFPEAVTLLPRWLGIL